MFNLAHTLGRPIHEIEDMPTTVFLEWLAYFEIIKK